MNVIEAGQTVRVPLELVIHRVGRFERSYDLFFTDERTMWKCDFVIQGEGVPPPQSKNGIVKERT